MGLPTEGYSECVDSCKHMSVLVVLNSVEFLVDLMWVPGQLVPQSSKAIITTHISAAGESDSAEYDSSNSPMGPNSPLYEVSERIEAYRSEKENGILQCRREPSSCVAGSSFRNMMLQSNSIGNKFSLSQVEPNIAYSFGKNQRKIIASKGTASSRDVRAINLSLKKNRLPQENEESGSSSSAKRSIGQIIDVSGIKLDKESGEMSSLYATQRQHSSQKAESLHLSPCGVDEMVLTWNRVMGLPAFQDNPLLPFEEWKIDYQN